MTKPSHSICQMLRLIMCLVPTPAIADEADAARAAAQAATLHDIFIQ